MPLARVVITALLALFAAGTESERIKAGAPETRAHLVMRQVGAHKCTGREYHVELTVRGNAEDAPFETHTSLKVLDCEGYNVAGFYGRVKSCEGHQQYRDFSIGIRVCSLADDRVRLQLWIRERLREAAPKGAYLRTRTIRLQSGKQVKLNEPVTVDVGKDEMTGWRYTFRARISDASKAGK